MSSFFPQESQKRSSFLWSSSLMCCSAKGQDLWDYENKHWKFSCVSSKWINKLKASFSLELKSSLLALHPAKWSERRTLAYSSTSYTRIIEAHIGEEWSYFSALSIYRSALMFSSCHSFCNLSIWISSEIIWQLLLTVRTMKAKV